MEQKRIVFLGTPAFAVASLKALVEAGLQVVAVVTMPDKPAGRGQKMQASPVKQYALEQGIPVLQPEKLKSPEFLAALAAFDAHLQVVVAFRMLPEAVWNMPPLGTYNLHASLLPQYRGAAPINWAIMNGETETGVTTFKLQHAIDTGDWVHQQKMAIQPDWDAGKLHDALMEMGAHLMLRTVQEVFDGQVVFHPQPLHEEGLKPAPKIFKEHCKIDWSKAGESLVNQIKGLSPYPGAFAMAGGLVLKVYKAAFVHDRHFVQPGQSSLVGNEWRVAVKDGWLILLEVQLEGKKRMLAADLLRGNANLATMLLH
jgi:methionyl-tRNA formyltransferase